jgi:hypothetical protein
VDDVAPQGVLYVLKVLHDSFFEVLIFDVPVLRIKSKNILHRIEQVSFNSVQPMVVTFTFS